MNALRSRLALVKRDGDRGDQALSYLGIVVLVALVATAMFRLGVPEKIKNAIQTQVEKPINEGNGLSTPIGSPPSDGKRVNGTP